MTAHECLLHAWLKGESKLGAESMSTSRHTAYRDKLRAKMPNWESFLLPIGRLAEYSSLRQLHIDKYKIHEFFIGRFESL
jgi:hypothetical protein